MTTPTHFIIPALITYYATGCNFLLGMVAGTIGIIPDIINNQFYRLIPGKRIYSWFHRPWLWVKGWKLWSVIGLYSLVYPLGLHAMLDYPFHNNDDEQTNLDLMIIIEVIIWWAIFKIMVVT